MTRPAPARSATHRRSGVAAPRWVAVVATSVTVAAVAAMAPPLAPKDIRVVDATQVALAAQRTELTTRVADTASALPVTVPHLLATMSSDSPVAEAVRQFAVVANPSLAVAPPVVSSLSPEQQQVVDDFNQGGLARVILRQFTSRLTSPDQLQIINDFYEGGVYQSEARRFLGLFTDPQQHQFIFDLVTGGLIQVLRNRLLDATSDPAQRAAIVAFFPDEVTDYRGGLITVLQRRLIAAAKGNEGVIALVNAVFDNPVLGAIRAFVGGGPVIGTPLGELPDVTPTTPLARTSKPTAVEKTVSETAVPDKTVPKKTVADETVEASAPPAPASSSKSAVDTKTTDASDVIKAGNKVEPSITGGATNPKPSQAVDGVTAVPTASAEPTSTPASTGSETKDAKADAGT